MAWFFSPKSQRFYKKSAESDEVLPGDIVSVDTALAERVQTELRSGDRLLVVLDGGFPDTVSRIVFSPSELMFFHVGINSAEVFPPDCQDVTVALANGIQRELANGRLIAADARGQPITTERPPESSEVIRSRALVNRDELLSVAALRIAPLQDAVDIGVSTLEDEALLVAWKRYRVELNRIDKSPDFPHRIVWPVLPSTD